MKQIIPCGFGSFTIDRDLIPRSESSPQLPLVNIDPETGDVTFRHSGTALEMRARILELKDALIAAGGSSDYPVNHEFCDGMYIRRLLIPRGELLLGKIHRKDCINFVERGDISLLTEFGARRVQAGYVGVSRAGIMKVGFAHADTVFVNIFRTDKTSIDEIEEEIACEDHSLIEREAPCQ